MREMRIAPFRVAIVALGFIAIAAVAFAQAIPGLFITSPIGSEGINVVNAGTQVASIQIRQVRDASGYTVIQQASSHTITASNYVSAIAFYGATSGTATITTPSAPVDGQRLQIFSTAGIGTLTLTANTGQTVNNGATSLAANGSVESVYSLAAATWYRIQ